MTPLLDEAMKWLGTIEYAGNDVDNPTILGWAKELADAGYTQFASYVHDSEPWCAMGMSFFAFRAGYTLPPHPNWSIGWKAFGSPREGPPQQGDVVVTWRRDPAGILPDGQLGHVQIFIEKHHDGLWSVVGCNQSDKVSIIDRWIDNKNLIAVRIPPELNNDDSRKALAA